MARHHLYMLVVDSEGNLQANAEVRILQPHTTNPIVVPIYESDEGSGIIGNPFTVEDGVIDIYFADPIRVRIGLRIGNSAEQYIEDIDIGGGGGEGEHLHEGLGIDSTSVGNNATSNGDNSVALGVNAASNANRSMALGYNATGAQIDSIAIGYQVMANGDRTVVVGSESAASASGAVVLGADANGSGSQSVALGRQSIASAANSTALGSGATAVNQNSTALGNGSSTTDDNQIMLGTSSHSTQIPGVLLLNSPGGVSHEIRVTDSGTMYSSAELRSTDTAILPVGDQSFSGGVGGWTATGSTLSITNDPQLSPNSLLTIETAQSSTTISSAVEVSESDSLIGHAWVYASDAFDISLTLEYLDALGDPVSESIPFVVPTIQEEWYKVSTRGTVPAGVEDVRLKVVTTSSDPGDVVYIESANIHRRE